MQKTILLIILSCFLVLTGIYTASAAYKFFNGEDWIKIDEKTCPADLKIQMKLLSLKAVEGGSMFSGTPILAQNEQSVNAYIAAMDNFYSNEANRLIPLYFALKIASMEKQGIPAAQVRVYKAAIQKKLAN